MEQTNQNQFKCSGDCLNCRMNPVERKTQWQYCAAQFTYNSMRMIESLQNSLESMSGTITELQKKVDAIQNSETDVFNPTEPISQEGDGEEE